MITFINKFWEFFKGMLTIAGPVIIILFTLAIMAGLIKWSWKTKERLKIVSTNPILLGIFIIFAIIGVFVFYKYALPIFR